ncbi:RlmF-related methyltransferase [Lacinutrix neustonica]|uniref:RlmF-related methyltransferase n=1 Tax=Lacinutrix neustonica TaxID=2980107 RepID=A0A9E8N153_9FLAO|nr:RlmF-related methyltransferase [Lacinutrix neustonica]WAC03944.1 RlmF-related methyltransferase [Lacinutrix neustonica]
MLQASKIDKKPIVLDIGTGTNCIYPLLGHAEYNWSFVASDCDETAIAFAEKIIRENKLTEVVELRKQKEQEHVLKNIIAQTDRFEASMCNPPFYKSELEAFEATNRKLKGLGKESSSFTRNFAGQANELWYKGGEKAFLHTYLYESSFFKKQCFWYTSLVSNKAHIKSMYTSLTKLGATCIKTIDMAQGNKKSRVVAWSFLTEKEQNNWVRNNRL